MRCEELPRPRLHKLSMIIPVPRAHDPAQLTLDLWRKPSAPPPDPRREMVWRLFVVALEVLGGHRPLWQLRPLVTRRVFDSFLARRPGGPVSYRLRTVHVHSPKWRVIEANGTATRAGRVRAIAGRLECRDEDWVATALALL
ncbi:Rv3235 family protein [Crossiella sp. S99.1]|uniref:Rv3235 family protein n=2 Tax=unclassified Crossiella TaxID=2620835 RepID=UPI001FFED436|nr:Rv3235 family protein [Crossiella sp. S99.1]MCK2243902.1 Rv3235 family protein [Crossiella sp. S99.2]MCK2257240.1 Rv3235 family protein [Crossiella sp. S99.1]